jgi:hypothetical protein
MWNPEVHPRFAPGIRRMVWAVLMSRHPRAARSPLADLQLDLLLFILNRVEWWTATIPGASLDDAAVRAPPKSRAARALAGLRGLLRRSAGLFSTAGNE